MEAITTMPLSLAFMCAAACHKRNGGKFSGQTYEARDKLREMAAKLAPKPPCEPDKSGNHSRPIGNHAAYDDATHREDCHHKNESKDRQKLTGVSLVNVG